MSRDMMFVSCIARLEQNVTSGCPAFELPELFECLSDLCGASDRPLILMIDEVDNAANNQVFLDFLAQLRASYIDRDVCPTFHSVILAGVSDIRNLKHKIRSGDGHSFNSPWNIAADFPIDMSLTKDGIAGMLLEYESDSHTGMNTDEIAGILFDYTSGYPFLVSRLCKLMDEEVSNKKKQIGVHEISQVQCGILSPLYNYRTDHDRDILRQVRLHRQEYSRPRTAYLYLVLHTSRAALRSSILV